MIFKEKQFPKFKSRVELLNVMNDWSELNPQLKIRATKFSASSTYKGTAEKQSEYYTAMIYYEV